MRKIVKRQGGWSVTTTDPPILTRSEWLIANLLGVLFLVMATLQLASFGDFKRILSSLGLSDPAIWALAVIMAELLAIAGLFRLRLSYLLRVVSGGAALLVSGFWFVVIAQAIASGRDGLPSSGLFGRFLNQSPGWWTILEASLLLFLTMYVVALTRCTATSPRKLR